MRYDPHNTASIPLGTPVIGYNGQALGEVHEVHPHYILVGQEGEHEDLDIPVHAIVGFENGSLRVSVTRDSATAVDDAHRPENDGHPEH